jgi:predicted house-cleaning NTP pyrophosphatase (Maf/HAM1 superfamily)
VARRRLIRELPKAKDRADLFKRRLEDTIFAFEAISGRKLEVDLTAALLAPGDALKKLKNTSVKFSALSDEHVKLMLQEINKKAYLLGICGHTNLN